MSRKLRPLAALAMIALIGAGCSNTPAETGDTGTGTGTGTASSGGIKNATNRTSWALPSMRAQLDGLGDVSYTQIHWEDEIPTLEVPQA